MSNFRFISLIAIVLGLFVLPGTVSAATLSPITATPDVSIGQTVGVDLRLDSQGEIINAVEAVLRYDPDRLQLLNLSSGGSFLKLWTEEPRLVRPGEITMAGGIPDGSLVVGGQVVSLTFQARQAGETRVSLDTERSGVYIHDGFGTPAELTTVPLLLTVKSAEVLAPQISSSSHPHQGVWYRDNTFLVDWTVHQQSVISYLLTRDPNAEPQLVQDNTGHTSFSNLRDGLWFFFFKERLSGDAWSPIARFEVRVDATPPEPFDIDVIRDSASGQYLVSAAPYDRTSGVAAQRVQIFRTSFWKPWQALIEERQVNGVVSLNDLERVKSITFVAFDHAGNHRSASWYSLDYRDQTRWLVLLVLGALLGLSLALLAVVSHRSPVRAWRKT